MSSTADRMCVPVSLYGITVNSIYNIVSRCSTRSEPNLNEGVNEPYNLQMPILQGLFISEIKIHLLRLHEKVQQISLLVNFLRRYTNVKDGFSLQV